MFHLEGSCRVRGSCRNVLYTSHRKLEGSVEHHTFLSFYLVLILHCPLAKCFISKGKMWGVVCFACSPTTQSALAGCSHPFSIISLLLWWIRKMLAVNLMLSETCSHLNEWGFTHITLHNVEVQTLVSHTESSVVCSTLWNSCWEILCHCHANQMEDFFT